MSASKKSKKSAAKKPAAKSRKSVKAKHGRLFRLARLLAILSLTAIVIVCIVFGTWAQTFDMSQVQKMSERSVVYDMNGQFYSRLFGKNRVTVPLSRVSPWFVKALLAREDTRFYHHHGVDIFGIVRAVVEDVSHLSFRQGASTITQQLARNTYTLGGRTIERKILEMFVAWRIERNYSKKQILAAYINRIYFGSGCFGAESASLTYFGKHVANLDLCESAMLVGLIRSPNRFSPLNNLPGAYAQRDTVVKRMLGLKMISASQERHALNEEVRIARTAHSSTEQSYARAAVLDELELILGDEQLGEGGLKVYTTIDPQLQKAAREAVDSGLQKIEKKSGYPHITRAAFEAKKHDAFGPTPYLQGSLIAIDNRTGGIRAIVGGRNYQESTYDRALLSKRQVGSTFKPFVYATAFAHGLSPNAPISDGPINIHGWRPHNDDHRNRGMMPAAEGLILSRNTMSIRIGEGAGIGAVRQTAAAVGLGKIPNVPSIFLGAFDETLKSMASAYTVFPNHGIRRQSYIIERVEDQWGNTLYKAAHITTRVMNPGVAKTTSSVLTQVLSHGTAESARSKLGFKKPAAGKTGTTGNYHDAWFIGYTTSLTCGVWVGFDKPKTIMPHGYGATLALPIWVKLMNDASEKTYPAQTISAPRAIRVIHKVESLPGRIFQSFHHLFGGH